MANFASKKIVAQAMTKHTGIEVPVKLVTKLNGKPITHIMPPAFKTYAAQVGEFTIMAHAYADGTVRAYMVSPVH